MSFDFSMYSFIGTFFSVGGWIKKLRPSHSKENGVLGYLIFCVLFYPMLKS